MNIRQKRYRADQRVEKWWAEEKKKKEKARRYAQELRDMRRRLNIMPLPRIPVDISK